MCSTVEYSTLTGGLEMKIVITARKLLFPVFFFFRYVTCIKSIANVFALNIIVHKHFDNIDKKIFRQKRLN